MLTLETLLIQETGHLLDWDSRAGQASSLSMAHGPSATLRHP